MSRRTKKAEHIVFKTASDDGRAFEHSSVLGQREGRDLLFSESERIDGRSASANLDDSGTLEYSIQGSSPRGEEQTLHACKLLVKKLNSLGDNWDEPILKEVQDIDCEAKDRIKPTLVLQVQVVHAITDKALWKKLGNSKEIRASGQNVPALVDHIKLAIEKKKLIAATTLTLALNATLLPALAFDIVAEEFRKQYGSWASSLGFKAIWIVGPTEAMVHRLDYQEANTDPE